MPKPFNGKWEYDVHSLQHRPKLAARIGHIAHIWTMIDVLHGELLCTMLGRESKFTTAVYLRLRGARSHALAAVAEEVLSPELLKEFRKIMKKCRDVEESRNDVIHGMWAIDPENKDSLIWIDPASHVQLHAARSARKGSGRTSKRVQDWGLEVFDKHIKSGKSYIDADFIDIANRIDDLFSLVFEFTEKVNLQLRKQSKAAQTGKNKLLKLAQKSGADNPPPAGESQN